MLTPETYLPLTPLMYLHLKTSRLQIPVPLLLPGVQDDDDLAFLEEFEMFGFNGVRE